MIVDVSGPEESWRAMMHTVKLLCVVFSCLSAVAWASSHRQPCRKTFFFVFVDKEELFSVILLILTIL